MKKIIGIIVVIVVLCVGYLVYQEYFSYNPENYESFSVLETPNLQTKTPSETPTEISQPIHTTSSKEAKKIPKLIDKSLVQSQALKEILRQIENKLALINEYSCVEHVTTKVKNGELAYSEPQYFRCPNLFSSKLTQTKHVVPSVIGNVHYATVDGKSLWVEVRNTEGGKWDKIYKCDLGRLQQAGYSPGDISPSYAGQLLNLFDSCDMSTLRLETQNDSVWIFGAKPNKKLERGHVVRVRLTINKSNGILKKKEFFEADPNLFTIDIFSDVKINPGLSDDLFTFSPTPGLEITDDTEDNIKRLRKQGLRD